MALKIQSTEEIKTNGVRGIVYGPGGVGKTRLAIKAPSPFIINVERKLDSLSGHPVPYVDVTTFAEVVDMCKWFAQSKEAEAYETLFVDSLTAAAQLALDEARHKHKNLMQAYGELYDKTVSLLNSIKRMNGRNVILLAQNDRVQDEMRAVLNGPKAPGNALVPVFQHHFPYLFAIRDDGVMQTRRCPRWVAQCAVASNVPFEIKPEGSENVVDLGKVFSMIRGEKS